MIQFKEREREGESVSKGNKLTIDGNRGCLF